MIERIRDLLKVQQLSPTQFADAIGIARPIVSHILSGRNKPSLEVVQKIIAAFPQLSLPWLLSGSGEMLAVEPAAGPAVAPAPPVVPQAAGSGSMTANKARTVPARPAPGTRPAAVPATASSNPVPALPVLPAAPTVAAAATATSTPSAPAPEAPEAALPLAPPVATPAAVSAGQAVAAAFGEPGKRIRRIVIFYHDGTFTDYQPE